MSTRTRKKATRKKASSSAKAQAHRLASVVVAKASRLADAVRAYLAEKDEHGAAGTTAMRQALNAWETS